MRWTMLAAGMLVTSPAAAHVKWFCTTVDVTSPPASVLQVLSPLFALCLAGFSTMLFAGVCADGWLARMRPGWRSTEGRLWRLESLLVRGGIGAYCLFLWDRQAVVPWGHAGAILTPELLNNDRAVAWLQLAVGALVLWWRSCGLAGLALLGLIGVGVARYGVFHMTDYVYFAGLAGYLILTAMPTRPIARWRLPLLAASLGFSLMWTAIEKFLYPQWTAEIVVSHPNLAFGFPVAVVIVVAGFVEFTLAFYLVVGRGLVRAAALMLITVFVSAIPEFGNLDSVGHLPIIAILLALVVRGATPLQAARPGRGLVGNAAAVCGLYLVSLSTMAGLYYALQRTA